MSTAPDLVAGLLSVISSFIAGLLGAGGDILYVPLLLYGLPAIAAGSFDIHTITGLSLAQSLVSTGGGGLRHYAAGRVETSALWPSWLVLAAGALASGILSRLIPSHVVLVVYALVTTAAAVILFRRPGAIAGAGRPRRDGPALVLLLGVGLLAGATGVGGGFLIIAVLLHRLHLPVHAAQGTGLVLTVCTAAPALVGKILTGQIAWGPVPFIVVGALVGSVVGSQVNPLLPSRVARLALASLVVVLGARVWLNIAGVVT